MDKPEQVLKALNEASGNLKGIYSVYQESSTNGRVLVSSREAWVTHVGARGGIYIVHRAKAFDGFTKAHAVRVGKHARINGVGDGVSFIGIFSPISEEEEGPV